MDAGSACILQARPLAAPSQLRVNRTAVLPLDQSTGLVPSFFTTPRTFYCARQLALRYNYLSMAKSFQFNARKTEWRYKRASK